MRSVRACIVFLMAGTAFHWRKPSTVKKPTAPQITSLISGRSGLGAFEAIRDRGLELLRWGLRLLAIDDELLRLDVVGLALVLACRPP
jgi:hypothetical protein